MSNPLIPLRRLLAALVGTAALGPAAAAAPPPATADDAPAIHRVEAIRDALRASDAQGETDADATPPERHAQWFDWPNWQNWGNWGNWGNWPNW